MVYCAIKTLYIEFNDNLSTDSENANMPNVASIWFSHHYMSGWIHLQFDSTAKLSHKESYER